jgi:hypothetical protein
MRRVIVWGLVAAAGLLLGILVWTLASMRPVPLRVRISAALAGRLNADVEIQTLDVHYFPSFHVNGSGISLRIKDRPELPPFITIDQLSMDLDVLSLLHRHVDTIHVDGLRIQVPPSAARGTLGSDLQPSDTERLLDPSKVIVEHLITHDAELSFVGVSANHRPLVFPIRELQLDRLGFDRAVPFRAVLINPIPTGLVDVRGSFGPWVKDDPALTPIQGSYVFSNADLSTIKGIHGILTSSGSFSGRITSIDVSGITSTPDFNLDLGGKPLPLTTTFAAKVDGTNGTTILKKVDAKLRNTPITAAGGIVNLPGPGRHAIDLDVTISNGRAEDLLALLSTSAQPMATGNVSLHSSVHLPPGETTVAKRLKLEGRFDLTRTRFKGEIQERVQQFSRRTQGKAPDEPAENVATNVRGQFRLGSGVMHMSNFAFDVPGATVTLDGDCDFLNKSLDFQGHLRMDASISKAVGGFKSIFLRLVDPFFRKPGGTVIPIRIGGTLEAPKFGLNFRGK